MSQTRRQSLIETCIGTAIGFSGSWLMQIFLVWLYNIKMSHAQNFQFVVWFTAWSLVRSYWVRRFFN